MTRTIEETTFPRITLDGDTGTASVQMVTRLIDTATGEQVGSDTYHRHVVEPLVNHPTDPDGGYVEFDDSNEHPAVRRARATFIDAPMLERYRAIKVAAEEPRTR